jgi:hypothetical protein
MTALVVDGDDGGGCGVAVLKEDRVAGGRVMLDVREL